MRCFYLKVVFFVCLTLLANMSVTAQINAVDDTFSVVYGPDQVTAGDILLNDTLQSSQALASNVSISMVSSTNVGITIVGSSVVIAGGTPQGTYTLVYQICDNANSTLCDIASVTINTQIIANPDSFVFLWCQGYNTSSFNVLSSVNNSLNNIDTFNGVPAVLQPYYSQPGNVYHPATVSLTYTSSYPQIQINTYGDLSVNPYNNINWFEYNYYELSYTLCEIGNPSNCSTAIVNVTLYPSEIYANDDNFVNQPLVGALGGTTPSILDNDYISCMGSVSSSGIYSNLAANLPAGFTLNQNGTITAAPGTASGNYSFNYQVCIDNNTCGNANVALKVVGNSIVVANYDGFYYNYPNSTTATVLANDTIDGNAITNYQNVTITALNIPAGFSINANGTIHIDASVPEGTYAVPYKLCTNGSSVNCYVNYAYVVVFTNRISGNVQFDTNHDGCATGNNYVSNVEIVNTNASDTHMTATNFGSYYLIGGPGVNTVSVAQLPSYFTVNPANQVYNFTAPSSVQATNFCVSANANVDDLEVVLVPRFQLVPGLPAYFDIWYKNNGSTTLSGQVAISFDTAKMSFVNSSQSPDVVANGLLTFNFVNLAPFEFRSIRYVKFQLAPPPTNNAGDAVSITGSISPVSVDMTPLNNTNTLNQTVVNSLDPNDFIVHEGESITLAQAQQNLLHYTIHFQNIGTSNAINIKIVNDLDPKLDWSTFELIASSHTCRVKNKNAHNEFLFENIQLSGTDNEPQSHGYVTYSVKPSAGIAVGDVIQNTANIYFDYNAPLATNTATSTVVDNLSANTYHFGQLSCFPNPVHHSLKISNASPIDSVEVTSVIGQKMLEKTINDTQTELDLSEFASGVYLIKVISQGEAKAVKILKE
ncbi:MAG: hypothetical protein CFE24_12020 [Flavobacterium sp. BFFFF2]|nr:MAG: hypothetical protein CFE24_12020 [Flavobacterium sp. BFFFF2]